MKSARALRKLLKQAVDERLQSLSYIGCKRYFWKRLARKLARPRHAEIINGNRFTAERIERLDGVVAEDVEGDLKNHSDAVAVFSTGTFTRRSLPGEKTPPAEGLRMKMLQLPLGNGVTETGRATVEKELPVVAPSAAIMASLLKWFRIFPL